MYESKALFYKIINKSHFSNKLFKMSGFNHHLRKSLSTLNFKLDFYQVVFKYN